MNTLVKPTTLRITGLIDLKFTNAMSTQFTHDLPQWLLLSGRTCASIAGRVRSLS